MHHNVPWHKHETCAEYDHRTRKAKKGEKASAKWIKETTKSCPKCERAVHKYTGCDHVTCQYPFTLPFKSTLSCLSIPETDIRLRHMRSRVVLVVLVATLPG